MITIFAVISNVVSTPLKFIKKMLERKQKVILYVNLKKLANRTDDLKIV